MMLKHSSANFLRTAAGLGALIGGVEGRKTNKTTPSTILGALGGGLLAPIGAATGGAYGARAARLLEIPEMYPVLLGAGLMGGIMAMYGGHSGGDLGKFFSKKEKAHEKTSAFLGANAALTKLGVFFGGTDKRLAAMVRARSTPAFGQAQQARAGYKPPMPGVAKPQLLTPGAAPMQAQRIKALSAVENRFGGAKVPPPVPAAALRPSATV